MARPTSRAPRRPTARRSARRNRRRAQGPWAGPQEFPSPPTCSKPGSRPAAAAQPSARLESVSPPAARPTNSAAAWPAIPTALAPALLQALIHEPPTVATRKASEMALEVINVAVPATIGGSADLTGSNNTKTKATGPLTAEDYGGRYVYYGIREFGMAAAMNGMALHGGVIPYGGTFLVFSDYCRTAIRLSALQNARVVYVMTHDSIGLGEDGPTHQPVEHILRLRADPEPRGIAPGRRGGNRRSAGSWRSSRTALRSSLTRQNLPPVRTEAAGESERQGAYVVRPHADPQGDPDRHRLGGRAGARRRRQAGSGRLSGPTWSAMPNWRRFEAQDETYREGDLPTVAPERVLRVSIEAGTTFGWERLTMVQGLRFGLDGFGASAPAKDLYDHFGLTVDKIAPRSWQTRRVRSCPARRRDQPCRSRRSRGPSQLNPRRPCRARKAYCPATSLGAHEEEERENDDKGRHQRVRAHRPPGRSRHPRASGLRARTGRDQRSRRRQGQCLAVQPRQRAWHVPGRSDAPKATRSSSTASASRSPPSATRPTCRTRSMASKSRSNAPASSPTRRAARSISRRAPSAC